MKNESVIPKLPFWVPHPIQRVKLGIFPSPTVFICIGRNIYIYNDSHFALLGAFWVLELVQGVKFGIFPSPGAYMEREAWNFSKSQGLYKGRTVYTTTRTSLRRCRSQSHIFLHIVHIIPHIRISSYCSHIPTYLLIFSTYRSPVRGGGGKVA